MKNKIINLKNNTAQLLIWRTHGEYYKAFTIDIKNIEKVKKYHWSIQGKYAYCFKIKLSLHSYLLGIRPTRILYGDHKDRDIYNNLEFNLRLATASQNSQNKGLSKRNKSGYKGVSFIQGQWHANIMDYGRRIVLGRYDDIHLAAKVYNIASKFIHKEFGYKNKLPLYFNLDFYHPKIYIQALRNIKKHIKAKEINFGLKRKYST